MTINGIVNNDKNNDKNNKTEGSAKKNKTSQGAY